MLGAPTAEADVQRENNTTALKPSVTDIKYTTVSQKSRIYKQYQNTWTWFLSPS